MDNFFEIVHMGLIFLSGGALLMALIFAANKQACLGERLAFRDGKRRLPRFARPDDDAPSPQDDGTGRTQAGVAAGEGSAPSGMAGHAEGDALPAQEAGAPADPSATPPRTWEERCLESLDALLATRLDLAPTFEDAKLKDPARVTEALTRWRGLIRLQYNVHAVGVTAAVCRLLPDDLPSDEADFWQAQLFCLLGEGEGCYLLGLSDLLLYLQFQQSHEDVALDAWRQAVEQFRRGGSAGHAGCMVGARLLAFIGHDVPFSRPEDFQEPLPATGPAGDLAPEAFYWRWRLAEAGDSRHAYALARLHQQAEPADVARAAYWYRKALEDGEFSAARDLFQLYRDGNLPDETGREGAICLSLFTLWDQKLTELSPQVAARLEKTGGEGIGPQVAACKTAGENLFQQLRTAAATKAADRRLEVTESYAQAGKRLNKVYANLEARQRVLPAAAARVAQAAAQALVPLRVGLVHGRMNKAQKEDTLAAFYAGTLDVLVATTVIEVGVNVPNATVMVIEGAERFGLAQLHQLRGRVGRGAQESWCFLMAEPNERLKTLVSTNDGFVVAQKDLELRGAGEFFGTRQHGEPQMPALMLTGDVRLLERTRQTFLQISRQAAYRDEYRAVLEAANRRFARSGQFLARN